MKNIFEKVVGFIKENKKMVVILLVFLAIGGIISGFCLDFWSKIGVLPFTRPENICVVIDAGHGGSDNGAVNGERLEKDDNLRLALKVKEYLEEKGMKVVMTRSDDSYPTLEERCQLANSCSADLYVSLHRNSTVSEASGVEIWIGSEDSYGARKLAENMMKLLGDAGISKNRGVKVGYITDPSKDYFINKNTKMTSCLVELGFISSDKDNELYDKNTDAYAKAIADAIEKQFSIF